MSRRGDTSKIEALQRPVGTSGSPQPPSPGSKVSGEASDEVPESHPDPGAESARRTDDDRVAAAGGIVGTLKRLAPRGLRRRLIPPLGHLRAQYEPRQLRVPRGYVRERVPEGAPRISVVVPTLNYGRYLSATLASIHEQEYPDLELIVCDGGSEDETPAILHRERERIAEVHAGPDAGQAEAINRGLDSSTGEVLAWVNADDLLLPGTLACVGRYFAEHPEVDMVYGNRVLIDEQGRDVGVWVTPSHSDDSLQWFDFIPQETAFWRRSLWERVGGIDSRFEYGFDWELFLRFQRDGARIVRLSRFLGAFRQHEGQKTRVHQEEALAELESIREDFHGRHVSLAEAQARAERLLVRAAPHHVLRRLAFHRGRGVPVDAGPGDAHRPTAAGGAAGSGLGGNGNGAARTGHEDQEGARSAAPGRD